MESRKPITINATELRTKTHDLIERARYSNERFIVETFGRRMVVILGVEEYEKMVRLCQGANVAEQNKTRGLMEEKPGVEVLADDQDRPSNSSGMDDGR